MRQPFKAGLVDIQNRSKGALIELLLGALIDDGTLVATKRGAVGVAFDEILPHFLAGAFKEEADEPDHRIISQNTVLRLHKIIDANAREGQKHPKSNRYEGMQGIKCQANKGGNDHESESRKAGH